MLDQSKLINGFKCINARGSAAHALKILIMASSFVRFFVFLLCASHTGGGTITVDEALDQAIAL